MRLHNFSAISLAKVIRAGDSHHFDIDLAKNRDAIVAGAVKAANEKTIDFNPSYLAKVNRRFCVSLKNYSVCLALRSISTHLSRKFYLKLMNRDEIVLGVIRALNDAGPMYIIRSIHSCSGPENYRQSFLTIPLTSHLRPLPSVCKLSA